jgi:hypothetical protein
MIGGISHPIAVIFEARGGPVNVAPKYPRPQGPSKLAPGAPT